MNKDWLKKNNKILSQSKAWQLYLRGFDRIVNRQLRSLSFSPGIESLINSLNDSIAKNAPLTDIVVFYGEPVSCGRPLFPSIDTDSSIVNRFDYLPKSVTALDAEKKGEVITSIRYDKLQCLYLPTGDLISLPGEMFLMVRPGEYEFVGNLYDVRDWPLKDVDEPDHPISRLLEEKEFDRVLDVKILDDYLRLF